MKSFTKAVALMLMTMVVLASCHKENNGNDNLGVTGPTAEGISPEGGIDAIFSVSDSKRVFFSKGNLQYTPKTRIWRFAESQLDYIGSANSNISSYYKGWIDLFGWGTGNKPANSLPVTFYYSTFTDWGINPISNGGNQANQWRTLTYDEWKYLMFSRTTNSGILYAKAMVNGVNGVLILPDDWSTSYYSLNSTNIHTAPFSSNTITSYDWTNSLEAHGAVFLPAAGFRNDTSVDDVGTYGYYWSSTPNENGYSAYFLYFFDGSLSVSSYLRYYGRPVRLVADE